MRRSVLLDAADFEPFASHPYVVDLKLRNASREPELANQIFDALVATGGYQVILMVDSGPIRSSHYTEEDAGHIRTAETEELAHCARGALRKPLVLIS
ncbi:hypothetical protein BDK92_5927 [Micromonospora pisi]|uniref:Uncharacterized protein n=1 Tax=Micromonospora pisi TaxID=589240 RepID=A0A495JTT8_9ACTN|nr:hypothetical protein BDK92_5927 [Micromonospora pisi]